MKPESLPVWPESQQRGMRPTEKASAFLRKREREVGPHKLAAEIGINPDALLRACAGWGMYQTTYNLVLRYLEKHKVR